MDMTMTQVREEIDLLDKELVLLLARRQKCIEMAAVVKNDKDLVIDEERIEEVIANVVSFGDSCGLDKKIAEPLWRTLINLSIEHEFEELENFQSSEN
jgi:isochorismate pyruvate lyase|tara:strand:- start:305 stop:598 length:294 start_codon:yes stop_codon:yes gene_type:complete